MDHEAGKIQDSVDASRHSSAEVTDIHKDTMQPRSSTTDDEVDYFDYFSDTFDDIDWDTFDRSTGLIPNVTPVTPTVAPDTTVSAATTDAAVDQHTPIITPEAKSTEHEEDGSSTYSFEELDDATLRELDDIEARFSQNPAEFRLSGPSSHPTGEQVTDDGHGPGSVPPTQTTSSSSQPEELPNTPLASSSRGFYFPEPATPQSGSSTGAVASYSSRSPSPLPEIKLESHELTLSTPRKRGRSSTVSPNKKGRKNTPEPQPVIKQETSPSPSPKGKDKGKAKAQEDSREELRHVLDGYEDEMSCPICCDIFVHAHCLNPCGHSICGSCGYDWIARQDSLKERPTCPVCRTKLIHSAPLIPNFALDNTAARHVQALQDSGAEGWGPGEAKLAEWTGRKKEWKQPPPRPKKKSKRKQQH